MKRVGIVVVAVVLLLGGGAGTALAVPGDNGNACPPGQESTPPCGPPEGRPCENGPPCGPKGEDPGNGGGATCPPATGIVSGAVVGLGEAINSGGSNALGDGVIGLGCALDALPAPLGGGP
jgi:hypothetical protein